MVGAVRRAGLSLSALVFVLSSACGGGPRGEEARGEVPAAGVPAAADAEVDRHGHGHGHGAGAHGEGEHRHHGGHHRFEDPERWAKEFDGPERLRWQKPDAVIAGLGLAADAVVADIGAGTGTFAVRFARALPQGKVYANDVEAGMVEYLGKRAREEGLANVTPVLGEAGDPRLPAGLNLAFMCDVFHHVEDVAGFFGHVRESLKPGGRLVIVDFKKDAPEDAPGPPAAMRVALAEVIARLEPVGFQVERVDESLLEFQYVVVFKRT